MYICLCAGKGEINSFVNIKYSRVDIAPVLAERVKLKIFVSCATFPKIFAIMKLERNIEYNF